jgi:diguanylate cyclase (GGDEF)-like protein
MKVLYFKLPIFYPTNYKTMNPIMSSVDRFFTALTQRQLLFFIALLLAVLSVMDYFTGFEASFSFFYLIPVAVGAWYLGFGKGSVIACLSIIIWMVSNELAGETYSSEAVRYWNAIIRLIFFIIFSQVLSHFKAALDIATNLAHTDALTGILNSREFHRLAGLELLRARRYRHPITIAYIDLDNFKQVNDRFGHSSGDQLLREITNSISSNLRRTDIFARMGGDEFALLLPEANKEDAENVIRKIQSTLRAGMRDDELRASFSLGAISFAVPPISVDEMLRQADALMYTVKAQGKNNFLVVSREEGG